MKNVSHSIFKILLEEHNILRNKVLCAIPADYSLSRAWTTLARAYSGTAIHNKVKDYLHERYN